MQHWWYIADITVPNYTTMCAVELINANKWGLMIEIIGHRDMD